MRTYIQEFIRRGLSVCVLGPLVLAIIYLILYRQGVIAALSIPEVCLGIFSLTALAFVAGGMNTLYQIERLPLMVAILIHGGVLYICYLVTYLVNNWLEWSAIPILVFTGIFVLGYLAIWAAIIVIMKKRTKGLNEKLKQQQSHPEDHAC